MHHCERRMRRRPWIWVEFDWFRLDLVDLGDVFGRLQGFSTPPYLLLDV